MKKKKKIYITNTILKTIGIAQYALCTKYFYLWQTIFNRKIINIYQGNGSMSILLFLIGLINFYHGIQIYYMCARFIGPFALFCLPISKEIDLAWAKFAFPKRQGSFLCCVSYLILFCSFLRVSDSWFAEGFALSTRSRWSSN